MLLLTACATHLGAQAPRAVTSRSAARPAVVLVSIDGLKPEYVLQADAHHLEIPNLRALLARGAHASGVIGVVPTVTYPSHTTLVTGVAPARHGIITNTTFDPLNKNEGGWYWYASDIRVPTLWDAVAAAGGTTGSVHWPVTAGARITWNLPQVWRTGQADDRKLVKALSTPELVDELERDLGVTYADGMDETIEGDELRGRFAVRMIEAKRPTLMLAYFTALDHEQHRSGPFSPDARATLERIDAIVDRLQAAASRAYAGNVVLVIVSDHGFAPTTRSLHLIEAFRTAGLIDFPSGAGDKPSGWRATLWPAGGSAAIVLRDTADLAMRDSVGRLLQRLATDSANGIDRIVDDATLRELGGFPGAVFLVSLREGFTFGWDAHGALVTASPGGGMHGYLPDVAAMRASLFFAGPGVPPGLDIGLVDQRSIAPTIAEWLRVRLAGAEAPPVLASPAFGSPSGQSRIRACASGCRALPAPASPTIR